jgi:hypothetical protein
LETTILKNKFSYVGGYVEKKEFRYRVVYAAHIIDHSCQSSTDQNGIVNSSSFLR